MDKVVEKAFETVRRFVSRNRYLVLSICAAYLGCDVDDVVLRCRKKNGGNYAQNENRESGSSRAYKENG